MPARGKCTLEAVSTDKADTHDGTDPTHHSHG